MLRSVAVLGVDGCPGGRVGAEVTGRRVRAWRIVARITEVDRWTTPARQQRVVEVHPELPFRRLDPRVVEPKRTARGAGDRDGRGPRMEIRV
jgi:predicted RNase H-like nuclease